MRGVLIYPKKIMLNILINAYACSPNMGSEPGMAWNWIVNLAKYCRLYVITEGEFKEQIEESLRELPQAKNIKFYYNPLTPKVREMCWNQGDWRFYYYYNKWQKSTLDIAKRLVDEHDIDLVHQLNMIGFREPGYLWKISDKPFIWGPVDAKEKFPTNYLDGASLKVKGAILLKNFLNYLQLKTSRKVRLAVQKSRFVVAASTNSLDTLKKYFDGSPVLINETGCYVKKNTSLKDKANKTTFDILWVGKLDFRKQLGLAIKILAFLENSNIRLHIVGDDNGAAGEEYKEMALNLNVADSCLWHGKVSHQQVQEIMQASDLFLFTSVAEGTPHVVLESLSNNLPVVCFDTCGQGDVVNEKVGRKVKLSTPKLSIEHFAKNINDLYMNRSELLELSNNCFERQQELSWDSKANQMLELYQQALSEK